MKSRILSALFILIFITSCNGTIAIGIEHPSDATSSPIQAVSGTSSPDNTALPLPTLSAVTSTLVPGNPPALDPTMTASPSSSAVSYMDDRSTPSQVIASFYNAINRQEYSRAYDYWINPSTSLGSFAAFASGYGDTASVQLVFGQITEGFGAGQIYYTVPVVLKTNAKNGTRTDWSACYLVHQSQPANFTEPPFNPMGIDRGQATPSDTNASDATLLAAACSGFPIGATQVTISGSNLNIDKSNYLDNRSGPVETVSSFLNAINLKQYARAYYYFETPATFPGPFDTFTGGYSDTDAITATFGIVQSEGAAGSQYLKVPLALRVQTSSAAVQTFVGCYTLRLAQPAIQTAPPFQPMGIISGKFDQVDNGTDLSALLPAACN